MRVVRTVTALREVLRDQRSDGVGFVPTMGALHEGHLSLIRAASGQCGLVVVSIFVNPTQFNDVADLATYPRSEARDVELAASAGADIVFAPSAEEMYPEGFATTVSVGGNITHTLEGAARGSAHFDGVATVVAKLLLAVGPDAAYFGAKDAQQVVVVRRMVADLGIPVRIEVCPTLREEGGLARSSRNARLSAEARVRALAIPRALRGLEQAVAAGERSIERLRGQVTATLASEGIEAEYLEFVDPQTLDSVVDLTAPTLFALAATVGGVRLIDNVLLLGE